MQQQMCWDKEKTGKCHKSLVGTFTKLWETNVTRRDAMRRWAMQYSQRNMNSTSGKSISDEVMIAKSLSENITKSIIDTAVSRLFSRRVRPMFMTEGGSWEMKDRARLLNLFCKGVFQDVKFARKARDMGKDALVFGNGILAIIDGGDCIEVERVFPLEIMVDDEDAKYGEPTQMFRYKEVTREVLLSRYPDKQAVIMGAECLTFEKNEVTGKKKFTTDMVTVIEAYHLPSGDGKGDGRHCIVVSSGTLVDEEWEHDYFPFIVMRASSPLIGWWGIGWCEMLETLQREHDNINDKVMETMSNSGLKWLVEAGSMVIEKLSNAIGTIYTYTGSLPTAHNPPTVNQDDWRQLERVNTGAHNLVGISEMASTGNVSGEVSGKALQERYDQEGVRQSELAQEFEAAHIAAAEQIVDLARDIDARGKGFEIVAEEDKELQRLKFKDVDLSRDKVRIGCFPVNFLPSTPSGKWQQIQDMMKGDFLTPEEGSELMDFPDLESVMSRKNSQYRIVERDIDIMLTKGKARRPDPFYNLQLAAQMAHFAYLKAVVDEYPEARLQLLRRYVLLCKDLMQLQTNPQTPPQMMPPGTSAQQLGALMQAPGAMPAPMPIPAPGAMPPPAGPPNMA